MGTGYSVDLTGQKFGYLTVESFSGRRNGHAEWNCVCDCGNRVTVRQIHLKSGHTKTCGKGHQADLVSPNTIEKIQNRKVSKRSKSGKTGVTWNVALEKWNARIFVKGRNIFLGTYTDVNDAIKARKDAELKYFGHVEEEATE